MSRSGPGPGCFHYVENVLVAIGVLLFILGVLTVVAVITTR